MATFNAHWRQFGKYKCRKINDPYLWQSDVFACVESNLRNFAEVLMHAKETLEFLIARHPRSLWMDELFEETAW